jgi:branched-chain amino acid transport system substrate-binding protein
MQRQQMRAAAATAAIVIVTACSNSTLPAGARGSAAAIGTGASGAPAVAGGDAAGAGLATAAAASSGGHAIPGRVGLTGPQAPGSTPVGPANGPGASAASGSTVGVTKDSIRISVSGPFSGTYGTFNNKSYTNAAEVWQAYVNSSGGINGRKIVLVKVDNQYTAEGAVAACKEVRSNGSFLAALTYGDTSETDCEDAAGIPVYTNSPMYLRPWRGVITSFFSPMAARAEVSFVRSPYMNAGGKKIGLIYADIPNLVPEAQAVETELKRQGLRLVHVEKVAQNQASFVSELSRMKAAGAEVVMVYAVLEAPGILRDARAIQYSPQWYGGAMTTTADLLAKAAGGDYTGMLGTRYYSTAESAAFAAYVAKVQKYQGSSAAASADTLDAEQYGFFDVLGRMLELAGPNLTRQSFLASAKGIDDYRNGLLTPFTLRGRASLVGQSALVPVECCSSDNTFKTIGPARESF